MHGTLPDDVVASCDMTTAINSASDQVCIELNTSLGGGQQKRTMNVNKQYKLE